VAVVVVGIGGARCVSCGGNMRSRGMDVMDDMMERQMNETNCQIDFLSERADMDFSGLVCIP